MEQAITEKINTLENNLSKIFSETVKADPSEFYVNPGEVVWRYFYYIPEQNMNLGQLEQVLEESCEFEITDHGCDGIIQLSNDVILRSSTSYEEAEDIKDSTVHEAQVGMEITIRAEDEESDIIKKSQLAGSKLAKIMSFFK